MAQTITHKEHNLPILEVDPTSTDNDSVYQSELSTYTGSLTSSVINYRKENGRRYHAYRDGRYLMPNDEEESERLDMLHELFLVTMEKKLFLAPVCREPQRVLDLGTGTGGWAVDFADEFPSAKVIGNDLSPTQPSLIPPNIEFVIEDIEDDWIYPDNTFDFIHSRFLASAIKDMPRLISQAFRCTKPNAWVEFQDIDLMMHSSDDTLKGTAMERYYTELVQAFEEAGYCTRPGPELEKWFREIGFVDIHVTRYYVPMGTWPKDEHLKLIGAWNLTQAESGFEAAAMAILTRFKNWSVDDVSVLAAKAKSESRNRKIHGYFDYYVVYGRKPE